MERVQFQQEQMLDELKDLVEKKVFTVAETKQIIKQRTAFESALVRRVAKKADFLRYASYEMGLEQLRRKRVERLKIPKSPATISDYALVRRQFHIFERALKRFKSDVGLWIEYIQVAKKEGARSLVGRITARALQLHPNAPTLYILAASHELAHLSPSTARTLLQRGIRLNSDSVEMWTEYVKMELGFVESLRRRWEVLGIDGSKKGKKIAEEEREKGKELSVDDVDMSANDSKDKEMDRLDSSASARKEILDGVIVTAVITSAVQALPKFELFESLDRVVTAHPSPPALQASIISHLDELLRSTLPEHPRAVEMLYTRILTPPFSEDSHETLTNVNADIKSRGMVLQGEALIEGIRRVNEMLMDIAAGSEKEEVREVYAQFALKWCGEGPVINLDENLRLYVVSSLQALIHRQKSKSPSLLCAHIKLLTEAAQRGAVKPAKVLVTARKYTTRAASAACVWLSRLTAMRILGKEGMDGAWAEARRSVQHVASTEEDIVKVWTWGLCRPEVETEEETAKRMKDYEQVLKESVRDRWLHEQLLLLYVTEIHEDRRRPTAGRVSDQRLERLDDMQRRFLTTGRVWQKVFQMELEGGEWGNEKIASKAYEEWRKEDEASAKAGWREWLLSRGKEVEASRIVGCRAAEDDKK